MITKDFPNKGYIKEYMYVTLLGLITCLLISVITYNPADSTEFNINSSALNGLYHVTNTFGILGASIADWLFQIFGIASILFLFVFFIQVLSFFRKPKVKNRFILRVFGYPQLILCYLGLLSAIAPTLHFRGIDILSGGFLGGALFHSTQSIVGTQGAILLFSLGAISSLTLCLGIRPIATIFWIFNFFPFWKTRNFKEAVLDSDRSLGLELQQGLHIIKEYEYHEEPLSEKILEQKSEV